jgi:hypothetical protein
MRGLRRSGVYVMLQNIFEELRYLPAVVLIQFIINEKSRIQKPMDDLKMSLMEAKDIGMS